MYWVTQVAPVYFSFFGRECELYVRVRSTWCFTVAPSHHVPRAHLRKKQRCSWSSSHDRRMSISCYACLRRSRFRAQIWWAQAMTIQWSSLTERSRWSLRRGKTWESVKSCMHFHGSRFVNAMYGLRTVQSCHGNMSHGPVRSLHACPGIRFNRTTWCQWSCVWSWPHANMQHSLHVLYAAN